MSIIEIGNHLVVDSRIRRGQLTFKGTRVPVETVLYFLSAGQTFKQLQASWPEVTRAALEESVQLAAAALVRQSRTKVKSKAKAKIIDEPAHTG